MQNNPTFKKGDKLRCVGWRTSDGELRANRIYEALTDVEEGVFPDRPFITVTGESGRRYSCHAKRFVLAEQSDD
jgi:hypothetical protein